MEEKEKRCPICGNAYQESNLEESGEHRSVCPACRYIATLGEAMASYLKEAQGKTFSTENQSEEENSLLKEVNEGLALIHVGILPSLKALESIYDVFYTQELTLPCPPYKVKDIPYAGLKAMHQEVYGKLASLFPFFLEGEGSFSSLQASLKRPSHIEIFVINKDGSKETFPRFDACKALEEASSSLAEALKVLKEAPRWGDELFLFMGDRYRFKGFESVSLARIYRAVYALDEAYRAFNLSLCPESTLSFVSTDKIVEGILKDALKRLDNGK